MLKDLKHTFALLVEWRVFLIVDSERLFLIVWSTLSFALALAASTGTLAQDEHLSPLQWFVSDKIIFYVSHLASEYSVCELIWADFQFYSDRIAENIVMFMQKNIKNLSFCKDYIVAHKFHGFSRLSTSEHHKAARILIYIVNRHHSKINWRTNSCQLNEISKNLAERSTSPSCYFRFRVATDVDLCAVCRQSVYVRAYDGAENTEKFLFRLFELVWRAQRAIVEYFRARDSLDLSWSAASMYVTLTWKFTFGC